MRALDQGRTFVVTHKGVPVGELVPLGSRGFVRADVVHAAFVGAPRIKAARFRRDLDHAVDQAPKPRG